MTSSLLPATLRYMTLPRITKHQKETLAIVERLSVTAAADRREGWVRSVDSGAPAALEHLYRKGYLSRKEVRGPRGGTHLYYRPSGYVERDMTQSTGEIDSVLLFARVKGIPVRVYCGAQEFRGYVGEKVARHEKTGATLIELGQRMIALKAITRVQYA